MRRTDMLRNSATRCVELERSHCLKREKFSTHAVFFFEEQQSFTLSTLVRTIPTPTATKEKL